MITLNYSDIFFIIWCALMLINIIINICVFIALRRTSNKSIADGLEKGAETVGKLFQSINIDGVKDVIGLVKDIVNPSESGESNDKQ